MEEKIINLIVVDDSFDNEETIVSKLRTTGYTARSTRVEDDEDLLDTLKRHIPDIVIYFEGMELISLKETIACLNKDKKTENCRLISVSKDEQYDVASAMRAGAVDATCFSNIDHLLLIIRREHQSLINSRQVARYQKAFNESEQRCTSLLDSSRDAIAYIHEGMHVYSNQSYLGTFDIEESDDLEGLPILDMVATDSRDEFKLFLRDYTKNEGSIDKFETQLRKPDGSEFSGEMELSAAQVDGEPCIQIIIRKEDATSEELERQLQLLSQKDQLTGLFNRQYCIEKLETVISDCEQEKYTAALLEIQIDNFDEIKNSVGVVDADQYIIDAAKTLNETLGDNGVLSRYTHDCFVVIAIDYTKENIENFAAQLQKAISQLEVNIKKTNINTTCCIGITLIDRDSPEYNDVLARSKKAVTSATEKGANQIHIYVPHKGELTRQEVDVKFKEQLTDALKNDKFLLHYQPIISLHGDTDERYEVFVRMQTRDDDKLIMPQDFLPAAERIGMSTAIDRWVLYKTIQEYSLRKKAGKQTRFFIKLSAPSIKDKTLIDWLSYQIKEKQIPANTLNFTVKETVAVTHLKSAKSMSHSLKELNCGFVLDDFGTGTHPFQLLEHIHADYVRIESSFMDNLADNPQNQDSIKILAEQAAKLDKLTIAQHVPDAASLSILWGMGVNFIQGYFLQEPLPEMEYDFTEMSG
ncbi:MAG: EAL domain-containing protein [Gammaproteobacteria bacterium]